MKGANEKLLRIFNHYGRRKQRLKAIEELSELQRALARWDLYSVDDNYRNVIEEMADVIVMIRQLYFAVDRHEVERVVSEKIERTLKRIEKEGK